MTKNPMVGTLFCKNNGLVKISKPKSNKCGKSLSPKLKVKIEIW